MNPVISECVSRSVVTVVDAVDPIDSCDSKTAPDRALFSCSVGYGVGDELAVVGNVGHAKGRHWG